MLNARLHNCGGLMNIAWKNQFLARSSLMGSAMKKPNIIYQRLPLCCSATQNQDMVDYSRFINERSKARTPSASKNQAQVNTPEKVAMHSHSNS